MMSWRRVLKSLQAVVAHGLLFPFTLVLSLKLHHAVDYYFWRVDLFSALVISCGCSKRQIHITSSIYASWSLCMMYNGFEPDTVKKMPKAELVKEYGGFNQHLNRKQRSQIVYKEEFERLQYEKILCRVCFDEHINVVLLPCRNYVLCSRI
ncbi:hypothetical protein CASFOL_004053 [Castilleja foliolosa]|uniref:Uncharacterized protein n=1 Tax=Castilleja foliolosa TaxID=1961234 RepID=A0ABD3EJK1_9LAMI